MFELKYVHISKRLLLSAFLIYLPIFSNLRFTPSCFFPLRLPGSMKLIHEMCNVSPFWIFEVWSRYAPRAVWKDETQKRTRGPAKSCKLHQDDNTSNQMIQEDPLEDTKKR